MTPQALLLTLDAQTGWLLHVAAERQAMTAAELAQAIIYRDMAARTGWPGQDGLAMRTALRDYWANPDDPDHLP